MIVLFKLIIIVSIWVLGIKIATGEEMILEKLGEWGKKKSEKYKIFDALIVCPFCMPSIHSLVGYSFAFGLNIIPLEWDWKLLIMYPIIVMGTSILAGFTWTAYQTINTVKEKNEAETEYYNNINATDFVEINKSK